MSNIYIILCVCAFFAVASSHAQEQKRKTFQSDVVGISEVQLKPEHWLAKLDEKQNELMDSSQIRHFNETLITDNRYVVDPLAEKVELSRHELLNKITQVSSVPSSVRYYADGVKLTDESYRKYLDNLNKEQVKKINRTQWGVVVKRSSLRTFPTKDRVFNQGMDTDLDRFQESGVFPGDTVAILHESTDKNWYLVQTYNYLAWLQKDAVAIGDMHEVKEFDQPAQFLLVTGSKVNTNYTPEKPAVSQVQLDMGVRLPLQGWQDVPTSLYGQNPFASYVIKLPIRNEEGKLVTALAMISRSQDVRTNFLTFTKANIVKQAFKFLGERYGWGHDYNGRDCTGFVSEIYKSFGVIMPRNSGQQGKSIYGLNTRFTSASTHKEKLEVIKNLEVGDLIYIPGHVMMYLGDELGEPYVIHDVKGLAYLDEDGTLYKGTLNGVSVTPLLPLHLSKNTSYLDSIYNIKRIGIKQSS